MFSELEIRYKGAVDPMIFYNKFTESPIITYSVSIVCGDCRKESFYSDKFEKTTEEYIKKTYLKSYKRQKHTVNFILEEKIPKFELENCRIRTKTRHSFIRKPWRWDFTWADEITGAPMLRERIKNNFAARAGKLELEIEYMKKDNNKIEDDINKVIEELGDDGDAFTNLMKKIYAAVERKSKIYTVKNLTNNPVFLSRNKLSKINLKDYAVLDKSDGQRCLILIFNNIYIEITEGSYNGILPEISQKFEILDCEKIDAHYYIFDIITNHNTNYFKRLECAAELIKPFKNMFVKPALIATSENIKKIYSLKRKYEIDGLIFNEIEAEYFAANIYKWKPAEMITFDFLILAYPPNLPPFVARDKTLYILICGCARDKYNFKFPPGYQKILNDNNISDSVSDSTNQKNQNQKKYIPVPFATPAAPYCYIYYGEEGLNRTVGEFLYTGEWQYIKRRPDKEALINKGVYGNDYFVILEQFLDLSNPVDLSLLLSYKKGAGYFEKEKSDEYKNMIRYNSFVKYRHMLNLVGSKTVLDIGSGKGQDLAIFNSLNIRRLICVEPDGEAITELQRRYLDIKGAYYLPARTIQKPMELKAVHSGFNSVCELNSQNELNMVDAINCNFALHYFLEKKEDYITFAAFCSKAKIITLTFLDSEVLDKFLPYKTEKYNIEKKDNKYFIKHHFADIAYPENIIDTNFLIECFKKNKYEILCRDSFKRHYEIYEGKISEEDLLYSSFYQYISFIKI